MIKMLINYLRACYPGIAIQTTEEARAQADVIAAAKECKKGLFTWSATEGCKWVSPSVKDIPDTQDLMPALMQRNEGAVYVMRDIQTWPLDRDPMLNRALRDLLTWAPGVGSCVILIGPAFRPQPTFEKLITVLDYSLPSVADLGAIAKGIADSSSKKVSADSAVIRAMGGLSTIEAENALALSLVESATFCSEIIYREKVQAIKRSGLLDIVDPDPRGLGAIGGLDELKAWITKRQKAYTPEAEAFGLPSPKGVLLCGVPGSGKSLSAKAIGTALGVPTIKLDIGALFNSLVGESEARTREALKLAEAMSPCVLLLDELDKGLAGAGGSGGNDSGVTRRVFGTVLSWMQERRRPVFLVATANQVEGLPPELLRKGRFDEIFAIDLPTDEERAAIFKIHLAKRNRKIDATPELITATKDFTGSEIENILDEALFNAFDQGRDITAEDMIAAARRTVPLAVTAKEQINSIREWTKTRARFASTQAEVQQGNNRRKLS